jgi:Cys-rich four helix bundle protein (predicted Tat secretion target)
MDRREFIAVAGTAAAAATVAQALAAEEPMTHGPKYKALEQAAADCVATGNDCLRHCLGMYAMKDTSMAGCADAAYQVVAACGALQALAAVNSAHVAAVAKGVEKICKACQTECEKFPKVGECKACGEACRTCAAECAKAA